MTIQKMRRWGNSLGVRLPQSVVQQVGLKEGASLSISTDGKTITLSPTRPRYTLNALLKTADPQQQPEAVDWGEAVGEEVW